MQSPRNLALLTAAALVAATASRAGAVDLVVMATNTTAVPGEKVFTVGIQITSADVAAGGANAVSFLQNLTFAGGSSGPIEAAGANNKQDIQSVWGTLDAIDGGNGGPSFPATGVAATQLYADSWWYSGGAGALQGNIDSAGDQGTVTAVPASDGSGVYAQGPGAVVGPLGYLWLPQATGIVGGATNDSTLSFTGVFGPPGLNHLDPNTSNAIDPTSITPGNPGGWTYAQEHALGNLLVSDGGTLTVPLAQIVASGNVSIPSPWDGGLGTFLIVGIQGGPTNNGTYNVLGGSSLVDPHAILDYATNTIHAPGVPEPSTFILAALGALALLGYRRRRRNGRWPAMTAQGQFSAPTAAQPGRPSTAM